ncbi:MAG: phage baseplate assembly protein V [[Clostridium] innocuum]
MDLMHMDEQNSFRNMVIATVCGYGTDEKKATLHVQLPYMKKGEDILEDVELLLPYGGKSYGFLCRAEIGDQVMVMFSGEHMRRAVAIGCIAPGDASIWEGCSEKNEQKQWLMKNGMKLSLWDEENAAKAEITCQDTAMQLDEKEQAAAAAAEGQLVAAGWQKRLCEAGCGKRIKAGLR